MSFILDALRKSEARRRLGETPDLHGGNQGSASPSPGRRGVLMLAVAGLVGFGLFALAGVLYINQDRVPERLAQGLDRERGAGPAVAEPAASAESAVRHEDGERTPQAVPGDSELPRERIVSDPDEIDAELARMAARGELDDDKDASAKATEPAPVIDRRAPTTLQPRTAVVAEAPTGGRSRPQVDAEDQALKEQLEQLRQREQLRQPMPSAGSQERAEQVVATAPPQVEPWSPGGAEYIRAWELPLSVRRNMPELKLTIHVYSIDEQNRFVLINGERFVTGETIRDGVRLVDIRREGAVVDFRDYRFLLEP